MALISLRQLLDHAAEHSYGVPAFNVNNLEQMRAIMMAADACDSPVIVQASAGARSYAGSAFLRHLIIAAIEEWPHIPVVMHQDHGMSPAICQRSIQLGFSSVMMDGSLGEDGKTPMDYDYNASVTREVVKMAHACGVSVEGEIGCLGSLETGMAGEEDGSGAEGVLDHEQLLTSADEAEQFVKDTNVDALAIAIGTSHGAYKFTRPPTGDILSIERVKEIHARIPNTHLVMHGSSSVPQEWLKVSNENGGDIGELMVCRLSKSLKRSNMASVKSISIPIYVWHQRARSVNSWQKTQANLIHVNILKPLWWRCQMSVPIVLKPLVQRVRRIKFVLSALKVWSIFINKRG